MIIITGSIVAKPETLAELQSLALEHVHRSRREPGCVSHAVHLAVEDPLRLFFFEEWADRAAIEAHFAVPESRAFVSQTRKLGAEMSPIAIYEATQVTL